MNSNERWLLQQFNAGNRKAFQQIYDIFFISVYHHVQHLLGNGTEARNMTAEIFERLWAMPKQFESMANIKAWLLKTSSNNCLDFLDSMGKENAGRLGFLHPASSLGPDPFNVELEKTMSGIVLDEIGKLPERCRLIIRLAYLEGLNNDEIANRLHLDIRTVIHQKRMGQEKLREKLPASIFYHLLFWYAVSTQFYPLAIPA